MRAQQTTDPPPDRLAGDQVQTGRPPDARRGVAQAAAIPDPIWIPAAVGGLIFAVGGVGWLIGRPWLFASLGPTAYLLAHSPSHASARPYNVIAGHLIALSSAFAVVIMLGAGDAPSVFTTHHLPGIRVLASGLALLVAVAAELWLGASHPPAAATVLLITLGGLPVSLQTASTIIVGLLLLVLFGEPLRRLRMAP